MIRLMVKKLDADKRRFTLIFASGSASHFLSSILLISTKYRRNIRVYQCSLVARRPFFTGIVLSNPCPASIASATCIPFTAF